MSQIPFGTNALRCLAVARSVNLLTTGDVAVVPLINTFAFFLTTIYVTNSQLNGASASAAACTLSINAGPAVSGTSISASAALASLTASNVMLSRTIAPTGSLQTATMGPSSSASNFFYINVTVVSAVAATADFFFYGYDIS